MVITTADGGVIQNVKDNIVEHIGNIYDKGELDRNSSCRDFRQLQKEGNRNVSRNIPLNYIKAIEQKAKKGGKENE